MRLASFNVENLTADPGATAPLAARLEILRPQLERLSADVLCLQEVDASRQQGESARTLEALTILLEETRYRDFHLTSTVDAGTGHPRDKHNLIILSRWPIRRVPSTPTTLCGRPGIGARAATRRIWSRYRSNGTGQFCMPRSACPTVERFMS